MALLRLFQFAMRMNGDDELISISQSLGDSDEPRAPKNINLIYQPVWFNEGILISWLTKLSPVKSYNWKPKHMNIWYPP